jgi:CRP-like cAMP-binding protein
VSPLVEVLAAIDAAEKDDLPATPELIAEKCGLEVEEVEMLLAEARSNGLISSSRNRPLGKSRAGSSGA